jgi:hypothetical protein
MELLAGGKQDQGGGDLKVLCESGEFYSNGWKKSPWLLCAEYRL